MLGRALLIELAAGWRKRNGNAKLNQISFHHHLGVKRCVVAGSKIRDIVNTLMSKRLINT